MCQWLFIRLLGNSLYLHLIGGRETLHLHAFRQGLKSMIPWMIPIRMWLLDNNTQDCVGAESGKAPVSLLGECGHEQVEYGKRILALSK